MKNIAIIFGLICWIKISVAQIDHLNIYTGVLCGDKVIFNRNITAEQANNISSLTSVLVDNSDNIPRDIKILTYKVWIIIGKDTTNFQANDEIFKNEIKEKIRSIKSDYILYFWDIGGEFADNNNGRGSVGWAIYNVKQK